MRIVRYTEMTPDVVEEWLPLRWGLVVDHLVYPLEQAPYLDLFDDGAYAPEIVGLPVALTGVELRAPVAPSKIACVGRNYAEHAAELQDSNTNLMIYSIGRIVAHVSRFMTLEPGDLILTGTPSGIGPVQEGNVMTVEIDGLGIISNPVLNEEVHA